MRFFNIYFVPASILGLMTLTTDICKADSLHAVGWGLQKQCAMMADVEVSCTHTNKTTGQTEITDKKSVQVEAWGNVNGTVQCDDDWQNDQIKVSDSGFGEDSTNFFSNNLNAAPWDTGHWAFFYLDDSECFPGPHFQGWKVG